jgi:hypothetical protein
MDTLYGGVTLLVTFAVSVAHKHPVTGERRRYVLSPE